MSKHTMPTKKKPTRTTTDAKKEPTKLDDVTSAHTRRAKSLNEETSALVLAEYMAIGKVTEAEIDAVMNETGRLSMRQIALTFRISEVLGIPDAFAMHRRFREPFKAWRATIARAEKATAVAS